MVAADGRMRVVCASANPGKVAEMQEILAAAVELLPRPLGVGDVVEDAGSLVGNARLKATAVAEASGRPSLADDTGLEVDALGGAPGVETATFAGVGASAAQNRAALLDALADADDRRARFRTIAMVAWPEGDEVWAEGVCEGRIAAAERGDRGFGYDTVFVPADGDGRTFAEMSAGEKDALSHRGQALRALIDRLATHASAAAAP